jgi:hypothetical protein
MTKKLHLALGVASIEESVNDYRQRLGQDPDLVIPEQYALWRTEYLNFSIRKVSKNEVGCLRHLGWETSEAEAFTAEKDCNGIVWEMFNFQHQAREIKEIWPQVDYYP